MHWKLSWYANFLQSTGAIGAESGDRSEVIETWRVKYCGAIGR
jgi:hypothetical protein